MMSNLGEVKVTEGGDHSIAINLQNLVPNGTNNLWTLIFEFYFKLPATDFSSIWF